MSEYSFTGGKRASATINWSFANQTLASDFTRPFSDYIDAASRDVIRAAFARWSAVSALTFNEVPDSSSVPIRIGFGSFTTSTELGETDFTYAGGLLANDTLVRLLNPATFDYAHYGVTFDQVTLHEIGHALGLGHTTDQTTLMYPYATSLDTDLSAGDIEGINMLYPLFSVAAADARQVEGGTGDVHAYHYVVTRYGDPSVPLTIDYAVSGAAYAGLAGSVAATASSFVGGTLPSGQLSFLPGSTTATLTISTAGNATADSDRGFSVALSTGKAIDSVTVRGDTTGLILDDDGNSLLSAHAIGIYRFFDTRTGTHFYSTDEDERNATVLSRPDLRYEGVTMTAVAAPAADSAAVPVFRFFDTGSGTHFYSASTSERDTVLATRPDLTFEGTAFYEDGAAQSGDTTVFRFFDTTNGTHFYTASAGERASIAATRPDLRDEGVAFYAPNA